MAKKDYAEIKLDRDRKIRYRWQDIRELSTRLEGISFRAILVKLQEADPETISNALLLGLRHEDEKLTIEKTDAMIDAFLRRDETRLGELLSAISEAIQGSGLIKRDVAKDDTKDPQ